MFEGQEIVDLLAQGRCASIWGTEMAMVFQDPMTSLNPVMKIGKQITESLALPPRHDARTTPTRPPIALLQLGRHPRARAPAAASTRTSCRAACASG